MGLSFPNGCPNSRARGAIQPVCTHRRGKSNLFDGVLADPPRDEPALDGSYRLAVGPTPRGSRGMCKCSSCRRPTSRNEPHASAGTGYPVRRLKRTNSRLGCVQRWHPEYPPQVVQKIVLLATKVSVHV